MFSLEAEADRRRNIMGSLGQRRGIIQVSGIRRLGSKGRITMTPRCELSSNRRPGGEVSITERAVGEVTNIRIPVTNIRGEVTHIIGPRGEVTHIIGHRSEVTDIRRPGNIIRRLTWKCVSTWRLVYECSVHSQRCGGSA